MDWIRFKLECVELILNTRIWIHEDEDYWKRERKSLLKQLLKRQLLTFKR